MYAHMGCAVKLIMYVIMYRFINHKLEIKITNCDINAVVTPKNNFENLRLDKLITENRLIFVSCYRIRTHQPEKMPCLYFTSPDLLIRIYLEKYVSVLVMLCYIRCVYIPDTKHIFSLFLIT